jgi:hypothetical protein
MVLRTNAIVAALLLAVSLLTYQAPGASAADRSWQVSKASGEVWVTNLGVQRASVTSETTIRAGDQIMTGQTGRVLLVRGEETMLISPNTVIAISDKNADGMTTTIMQRAGSILLEVEKRNVKHFEVDTPYLAAVVKGTKFSVSLDNAGSHVEVFSGQVEVSSHKSGEIAQVTPGQTAAVSAKGASTISLSGSGPLLPIEKGVPRSALVIAMKVPPGGLVPEGSRPVSANRAASVTPERPQLAIAEIAPAGAREVASLSDDQSLLHNILVSIFGSEQQLERWKPNDGMALAFGLPMGIGVLVSVSVMVQRRWQRRTRA